MRHQPNCTFSAHKEVVLLMEGAYQQLGLPWPSVADSPISSSLPKNIFSIGTDNVNKATENRPDIQWLGTNNRTGQTWPLKPLKESIVMEKGKVVDKILVNADKSHVIRHYEVYNHTGEYLGIMDNRTQLLNAESIPFSDRIAKAANDVKKR